MAVTRRLYIQRNCSILPGIMERLTMLWRRLRWWLRVPINLKIGRYQLWFGHRDEFNDCG